MLTTWDDLHANGSVIVARATRRASFVGPYVAKCASSALSFRQACVVLLRWFRKHRATARRCEASHPDSLVWVRFALGGCVARLRTLWYNKEKFRAQAGIFSTR